MSSRADVERPDTMGDLLAHLTTVDDELTVYVAPGAPVSATTRVWLLDEQADFVPDGVVYLLEVGLIREVIEVWSLWRGGCEPTLAEACDAVVHYARHDSFQPVS